MVINHLLTAMILQVGEHEPRPLKKTPLAGGKFAGPLWYNSLFWPNFPDLVCLNELHEDPEERPRFFFVEKNPRGVTAGWFFGAPNFPETFGDA